MQPARQRCQAQVFRRMTSTSCSISMRPPLYYSITTLTRYVHSTRSSTTQRIHSSIVSYAIPQFLLLTQGRKNVLPKRRFDLGYFWGTAVNVFSCAWTLLFTVIFCLPYYKKVTKDDINYANVITIGITCLIGGLWIGTKQRHFTGPVSPNLLCHEATLEALTYVYTEHRPGRI